MNMEMNLRELQMKGIFDQMSDYQLLNTDPLHYGFHGGTACDQ